MIDNIGQQWRPLHFLEISIMIVLCAASPGELFAKLLKK